MTGDGSFTLPRAIASGSTYDVQILAHLDEPQRCRLRGGHGTATTEPIAVTIACEAL